MEKLLETHDIQQAVSMSGGAGRGFRSVRTKMDVVKVEISLVKEAAAGER